MANSEAGNEAQTLPKQLLTLHQGVGAVPVEYFRQWALELLVGWLGCDHAMWVSGTEPKLLPHSRAAFGNPPAAAQASTLELQIPHTQRGVVSLFTVQRNAARRLFTTDDAQRFSSLAPHLLTAWQTRLRLSLHVYAAKIHASAAAIINAAGFVEVADCSFYAMLRTAWPDWRGSRLPEALLNISPSHGAAPLANIGWTVQITGDLRVLIGTPLGPMAGLTGREQTVTRAVLDGASHAEVAAQLGISTNTARNTLARVYKKLSVRNRLELARRVRTTVSSNSASDRRPSLLDGCGGQAG